jgi:hypothetical protein
MHDIVQIKHALKRNEIRNIIVRAETGCLVDYIEWH